MLNWDIGQHQSDVGPTGDVRFFQCAGEGKHALVQLLIAEGLVADDDGFLPGETCGAVAQ
ncbi:MAG: hypothetical protein GY811_19640 [Myxococcales bacterium]|nr:hypothetical protein [Myxococcales bacterium]